MKTERFVATVGKVWAALWNRVGDILLVAGLFAASLIAYSQTLAPSVATLFDDSLEFPLVADTLAIAHPSGYPLYTLLGKAFTLGPFANVAWAVNLLSAVAGALTTALVYLVARQLTRRRLPALLGAVSLAASPVFWSQSVIAEVYTLNSALVAALLLLVLWWARRPLMPVRPFARLLAAPDVVPGPIAPDEGVWLRVPEAVRRALWRISSTYRRFFPLALPRRRLQPHPLLFGLAAAYALSLTHHLTNLLLAPALVAFMFVVERRIFGRAALLGPESPERPRWLQVAGRPLILLLLSFIIPLLLYLYLPLRGHVGSLDGTYANTWSGFWQWVTASSYNVFLGDNPLARDLDAAFYADLFWQQFGPVGLALALAGTIGLVRQPRVLLLIGLAFVAYVGFAVAYRVPDVEVFFIPAFLLVAICIAVGLDYAADLLRPRGRSLAMRRLLAATGLLLFLLAMIQPLAIACHNYPDLDLSQRWIVHDYGRYLLEEPLPADSTIVGLLGEVTLLRYFQRTANLRPDIETIVADDEDARRAAVEAALAGGGDVYVTRPLPGLSDEHALGAVLGLIDVAGDLETLIHVGEPNDEMRAVPRPTDLELVPGLRLLGYGLREHKSHWQAWLRLRLWWQAPQGMDEGFKVSARLVDAGGHIVAAADAEPVSGAYPSTAWRSGEVVVDAYEIPLPAGLPPGQYTPLIIVYEAPAGAERGRVELPPVHLSGNTARPPRRALEASMARTPHALFGDVELLGYTPPDPGIEYGTRETVPLTLLWQARGQPSGDLRVAVWLEGDGKFLLGKEPVGGRYTAVQWADGQVVRQELGLSVPGGVSPGTYQLRGRVTRDGLPVAWGRWLVPLGSDLDLGVVRVAP